MGFLQRRPGQVFALMVNGGECPHGVRYRDHVKKVLTKSDQLPSELRRLYVETSSSHLFR